jgi:predicted nucleic acid-binding protein
VGTLIDTSVLVDAERGKLEVDAALKRDIEFSVSAVTASELLHGVHRAPDGRRRRMRSVRRPSLMGMACGLGISGASLRFPT